jgi:hypothetical protein
MLRGILRDQYKIVLLDWDFGIQIPQKYPLLHPGGTRALAIPWAICGNERYQFALA